MYDIDLSATWPKNKNLIILFTGFQFSMDSGAEVSKKDRKKH